VTKQSAKDHLSSSASNNSTSGNGNGGDKKQSAENGGNSAGGGNNNANEGTNGSASNGGSNAPPNPPAAPSSKPNANKPHPEHTNVWNIYADNVHDAFKELQENDNIECIGVECFFPGLVLRPTIPVDSFLEHHYATLRTNVDCTNLIQLDLTILRNP
jgi:hypothetical protein